MSETFRYCFYCDVDCKDFEPEHKPDCPSVTGLYPVTERELGMRGPNDPYAQGMACMDCGVAFSVGDTYTHRQTDDYIYEVVCPGCSVLNPSEYQLS